MAKTKPASGYEPEAIYQVTLSKKVKHGSVWLRPTDDLKLKGKVIVGDVAAAVETAVKIEDAPAPEQAEA